MQPHTSVPHASLSADEDGGGAHQFWNTQPVPQASSDATVTIGPMDAVKSVSEVSRTPYPIASTFEWWTPDLHAEADLHAVYELLRDNYVEDHDSLFRFNYSEEFLRWALMPPDYVADWHVAIRRKRDGKLLAFISGIPLTMHMGAPASVSVGATATTTTTESEGAAAHVTDVAIAPPVRCTMYDTPRHICEINFLCIHKQLRDKRLAPILIKEVTRRVNLHDKWQAVYTAGIVLPTPFATGQYFHRTLNPEKLIATRFSRMPEHYSKFANPMAMLKRLSQLPPTPRTRNLRVMREGDVPHVAALLRTFLTKYDVYPIFTEAEVQHYLLPRDGVVYTYVVEHHNTVTDFLSFYCLPSTVIGNSKYDQLRAAYVYYYATTTVPLTQLMQDLLILAHTHGFDVCNLVEILDNRTFLKELKFSPGDGYLHYYFYNWAYPKTDASRIGLVML